MENGPLPGAPGMGCVGEVWVTNKGRLEMWLAMGKWRYKQPIPTHTLIPSLPSLCLNPLRRRG